MATKAPRVPDAPKAAIERYLAGFATVWADRAKEAHTDAVVAAFRAGYKAGYRAASKEVTDD